MDLALQTYNQPRQRPPNPEHQARQTPNTPPFRNNPNYLSNSPQYRNPPYQPHQHANQPQHMNHQ